IDCSRQAGGLVDSGFEITHVGVARLRAIVAAARSQVRADHDDQPAPLVVIWPREADGPFAIAGFQSGHSHAEASSPPSNSWIGAPGMM
ncbi:hypothetical protein, partial [Campylobacter coli]|uniref:hypothetical protein n=1 Tax=Campylobacter coli TaxID=195 RepID=UPI003F7C57A0